MSNDKKEPWRDIVESVLMAYSGFGEMGRAAVEMTAKNVYLEFAPLVSPAAARAEGFSAGLTRARDLLAAHADESEALARGQATEAEQAQTRAAASATRAAVQRGGVALLDREIAALKGEGK